MSCRTCNKKCNCTKSKMYSAPSTSIGNITKTPTHVNFTDICSGANISTNTLLTIQQITPPPIAGTLSMTPSIIESMNIPVGQAVKYYSSDGSVGIDLNQTFNAIDLTVLGNTGSSPFIGVENVIMQNVDSGSQLGDAFLMGATGLTGAGTRMVYWPNGAFRQGTINSDQWDLVNCGINSNAHGENTIASGNNSHSEGYNSISNGINSHAEGEITIANGINSHSEGEQTRADGQASHAEGSLTIAMGINSHAEGRETRSNSDDSHTEGAHTQTNGYYSHAEGLYCRADGDSSHSEGQNTISVGQSSHSEGRGCTAFGTASHAEGLNTVSIGDASHAEGENTRSVGLGSHSEGFGCTAFGQYSHSEGENCISVGQSSHSEGFGCTAFGAASHSEGQNTVSFGDYTHSEGQNTVSFGDYTHSEGQNSISAGIASHAEGRNTLSIGRSSHSEGQNTISVGNYSHAEGENTISVGDYSHSEGFGCTAFGAASHAEGQSSISGGIASHAEGLFTSAFGDASHAEGFGCTAFGQYSHAEGFNTLSIGNHSHSEGQNSISGGIASHAEGLGCTAFGDASHAEGQNTISVGDYSHAEGEQTRSVGFYSHAEGVNTRSVGIYSHAEGSGCTAFGQASHACGVNSTTARTADFAHGTNTSTLIAAPALNLDATGDKVIFGRNGAISNSGAYTFATSVNSPGLFVANGVNAASPAIGFSVTHTRIDGNAHFNRKMVVRAGQFLSDPGVLNDGGFVAIGGAADFAELFEFVDVSQNIKARFVTFSDNDDNNSEKRIRLTNNKDEFVLGVVSLSPAMVCGNYSEWPGKYVKDVYGKNILVDDYINPFIGKVEELLRTNTRKPKEIVEGETVEETPVNINVEIPNTTDYNECRKIIIDRYPEFDIESIVVQPLKTTVISPEYKPSIPYVPRSARPEWAPIGLIGRLEVEDDGTCEKGKFCTLADDGKVTLWTLVSGKTLKWFVICRISTNIVRIIVK
jgi:trimeric autotransporter adhesin